VTITGPCAVNQPERKPDGRHARRRAAPAADRHLSGHDGTTLLTHNTVYQSVEDRDLDLRSGLEESVSDSMDRLAVLLARLAPVSR
jgi:hypothetical protein